MVLLALGASGYDCSNERLEPAHAFLLSQKGRWTAPGKELDGALVIQALLDTGGTWDDVAAETQALSRWAKAEAFWQGAIRSAKESLDQSCRVAQIASHLVSIGWTAIRTDLPAFLDALDALSAPESVSRTTARAIGDRMKVEVPLAGDVTVPPLQSDLELETLRRLERVSLQGCAVVGEYRRYDEDRKSVV
jgi:hypothetical protein